MTKFLWPLFLQLIISKYFDFPVSEWVHLVVGVLVETLDVVVVVSLEWLRSGRRPPTTGDWQPFRFLDSLYCTNSRGGCSRLKYSLTCLSRRSLRRNGCDDGGYLPSRFLKWLRLRRNHTDFRWRKRGSLNRLKYLLLNDLTFSRFSSSEKGLPHNRKSRSCGSGLGRSLSTDFCSMNHLRRQLKTGGKWHDGCNDQSPCPDRRRNSRSINSRPKTSLLYLDNDFRYFRRFSRTRGCPRSGLIRGFSDLRGFSSRFDLQKQRRLRQYHRRLGQLTPHLWLKLHDLCRLFLLPKSDDVNWLLLYRSRRFKSPKKWTQTTKTTYQGLPFLPPFQNRKQPPRSPLCDSRQNFSHFGSSQGRLDLRRFERGLSFLWWFVYPYDLTFGILCVI